MLNNFDTPEQTLIAKLKFTIERFKKYDKERKDYYAKSMQRLGELESYIQEIEDKDENRVLSRIKSLRKEINRLNLIITANKYAETTDPEALDKFQIIRELVQYRQTAKHLTEENKILKDNVKTLTKSLIQLNQEKL